MIFVSDSPNIRNLDLHISRESYPMKEQKIIIFGNGTIEDTHRLCPIVKKADYIICADGGAVHCHNMNFVPDILLGDMDSVPPRILQEFQQHNVKIKKFPPAKDSTDLELAIDHALSIMKPDGSIHVLGGLGGRWDMSLATVFLLARPDIQHKLFIYGDKETISALRPGKHIVYGEPGQSVSFLPLHGDVKNMSLTGFRYPANKITLKAGASLAVSNSFAEERAAIQFNCGILLMIQEKTTLEEKR